MTDRPPDESGATAPKAAVIEVGGRKPAEAAERCSIQEVTILLSDLRGFSGISESHPPEVVLHVLNRYLARMCEVAVANGGTIDKFMGDAVMVLFGAPHSGPDDARRAVTCAVQMQGAMEAMNHEHARQGLPSLYMGVGVNTGKVIAGMLGSELHSEYTVIGNEVNVASRIEAFSLRGQVLISETTYEHCRGFVETAAPMAVHMKGQTAPVRLREVLAIPSLGLTIPRQDGRKSPRVEVRIPCIYQTVVGKVVMPPEHKGVVLDMSYEGVLAEVDSALAEHDDILVRLDLSLVGGNVEDIYAKVRSIRAEGGRRLAGIEFTAIQDDIERDIRRFVQLMIQGSPQK